jgi:hypothetical protein
MDTFRKLFGSLLTLVYHCFDRIVILGYLPFLTREEQIVYFFRDVHGISPITKEALRQRTTEYQQWVEAFARNHQIPIEWANNKALKVKGLTREDYVRPYCRRLERRHGYGPYFIFKSLEDGPKFKVIVPKTPTTDPNYRPIHRTRGRYTHYYFYIRDEVLGPFYMSVGSYLPFQTTYNLNGHHFIAGELARAGVHVRRDDNAFLATSDVAALQAAADRLSPAIIRKRLDYWTRALGPKFSPADRAINLRRDYSLNQVEYCLNVVLRRTFPIHHLFERACELGVFRLTADVITQIFGVRKHRRMRGKLHTMLEKVDHGHHVLRVYCKSLVARMYEKFSTFLRLEICVNRLRDLGLNKGLDMLPALRETLIAATDRLAAFEAEMLNVHVDFPVFQRLALPVPIGQTRIPGIKIHDTRIMRLLEVLLHAGPQLAGWRTVKIHAAVLAAFGLTPDRYSLTQLRYDLRKLKAHGLLERLGRSYAYRLTDKGIRVGALFILFHKRICGPLANSLFQHRPEDRSPQPAKIEKAYHHADAAVQQLIDLLAA